MSSNESQVNATPGLAWLFASPIGRLGREPYWLVLFLVWIVIGIAINMWFGSIDPDVTIEDLTLQGFVESNPLFPVLFFVLQWVELALVIKRCQDIGVTGFLALLIFVPGVNILVVLVLGFIPSQQMPNRFGPFPNSYYRRKP
ncbi:MULTISPECIES: DUF805 domain-containing protein [Alphaproteobacteria]|uniref:DUF805 domain-containing protein n=1 Tax=Alphaproteobacteria TaxID=28211 RepID=UPI0032637749